jgi:hypothetical protein
VITHIRRLGFCVFLLILYWVALGKLTASAPPTCAQPLLTELSPELEPLRSDFNPNASSIRLLLILSPS